MLVMAIPIVVLLVILSAFYLGVVGVPQKITDFWMQKLMDQGVRLHVDKLYMNIMKGLAGEGVSYHYDMDSGLPSIQVDRVELDVDVLQWFRGRAGLKVLSVTDATIRLFPEVGPLIGRGDGPLLLEDAELRLRFDEPGLLHIEHIKARCAEIVLQGRGDIVLSPHRPPGRAKPTVRSVSNRIRDTFHKRPAWLTECMKQVNALQFDESPIVHVAFHLDPHDWQKSRVGLDVWGSTTRIRGIRVDAWNVSTDLEENRVTIEELVMSVDHGKFTLTGDWNLTNQLTSATIHSSLPPTYWRSLIPVDWRDRLRDQGLHFDGPVHVDVKLGPAHHRELLRRMSGSAHVQKVDVKDVWVDVASFDFDVLADELEVDNIQAILGRDGQHGSFEGRFELDRASQRYHGHVISRLDYTALIPILTSNLTKLVRQASFSEDASFADLEFAGKVGDKTEFKLDGKIAASNFVWRGTHVQSFDSHLLVTNRTTALNEFVATRAEGGAHGSILLDFEDARVDVDVINTADPLSAGRAAGKVVENILHKFRFEGPTTTKVFGVVHVGTNGVTDLHAHVNGEQIGFAWILVDQATFDLHVTGKTVNVLNATGTVFGGEAAGAFTSFPAPDTDGVGYALELQLSNVDFSNLVSTAKQVEGEPYRGWLEGQIHLTGMLGERAARTTTGRGDFRISNGHLLQIPLFGGLSDILSQLVPGLGFATETELQSDFVISNKVVSLRNADLGGPVVSLNAVGDYSFDQKLDFDVVVYLLQDGTSVGKIVQFVTTPISKLLEFDLEGTLNDPIWRPKLLPKELFGTESEGDKQGD